MASRSICLYKMREDGLHGKETDYTVKTFGLLQPYYGHLSCMPVVYVTLYKLQGMLPI